MRVGNINIQGGEIAITASADEVLRRLRRTDTEVNVWIDGVCINQEDLAEREAQVSFMHKVYASAERSFVWLGPEADDSNIAMQYAASLDWVKYDEELRTSIGT